MRTSDVRATLGTTYRILIFLVEQVWELAFDFISLTMRYCAWTQIINVPIKTVRNVVYMSTTTNTAMFR